MNTPHILIADDELCIIALLEEEFSRDGYYVSTATDGYEAILKAVTKPCDLLIIDILMPKLNGIEAIAVIKKVFPNLPIIAITGHIGQGYMNATMRMGVVDCLKKPFHMPHLQEAVKYAINRTSWRASGG